MAHTLSGQTVTLNNKAQDSVQGAVVPGAQFRVEDWASSVFGGSVAQAGTFGNWAARNFITRIAGTGLDPEQSVYGKIGALGYVVHETEL